MADFSIALNARALDGTLLVALEDEANGLYVRGGGLPAIGAPRIRRESSSPWVDGRSQDGSTKDQYDATVLLKVFGPTWASVETRLYATLAALDVEVWLLEQVVEGVTTTWRAGPVEPIVPPISTMDLANNRRYIALSFPVQPTATVTFPEEP